MTNVFISFFIVFTYYTYIITFKFHPDYSRVDMRII